MKNPHGIYIIYRADFFMCVHEVGCVHEVSPYKANLYDAPLITTTTIPD